MKTSYNCRKISPGAAEGEILISKDPILFYQTDSRTGAVIERGHDLYGKCIKDKILVFPGGKGSSAVQADGLYKLGRDGTAPKAFIIRQPDTVLVATAIIMGIPMVDRVDEDFYGNARNGDSVSLDAAANTLHLYYK